MLAVSSLESQVLTRDRYSEDEPADDTFEWVAWRISAMGRASYPLLEGWLVPCAQAGQGPTFVHTTFTEETGPVRENQLGLHAVGGGGLLFMPRIRGGRHMGLFLQVEAGEVERVATWHQSDDGAGLVGDEVILSQLAEITEEDAACILFTLQGDSDDGAAMSIEEDTRPLPALPPVERPWWRTAWRWTLVAASALAAAALLLWPRAPSVPDARVARLGYRATMSLLRRRLAAVALGLGMVLLLLAAAEVGVRLLLGDPPGIYALSSAPPPGDPLFVEDPVLFWRQRPDRSVVGPNDGVEYRTNSLGLRDAPRVGRADEHMLSVLCLGDSSTWGDGVAGNETWPNALELLARKEAGGRPVDVLNAGVPGYTTTQSLAQERQLLAQDRFDIVIIANMASDLFLAPRPDSDFADYEGPGLLARSHLFRRLVTLVGSDPVEQREGWESWVRRVPARPDYSDNLAAMVELSRSAEARVVLLALLPVHRVDALPPGSAPLRTGIGAEMTGRLQEADPEYRAVMAEVAATTDTAYVDMAPVVAADLRPGRLYGDQVHPSPEGHRAIAQELLPVVLSLAPARGAR